MSLVPVPAEQQPTTCANCGADLAADQRYCLECGRPASPVRLAFLDVLESERPRGAADPARGLELTPAAYAPVYDAPGPQAWLRRNTGLLALLGVLVLCLIAGLLVGHWASQGHQTAGASTIKIEGLNGLGTAAAATPTTTTATPASSGSAAKEEAEAAKEAAKETKAEKAPPPAPKKVSATKLQKLSSTSGKKHHEEIEALGAQPIETGG